jgi:glucose/arabinose dehydrogenase
MSRKLLLGLVIGLLIALTVQTIVAQNETAKYIWVEVAAGFDNPLYLTHAGDGTGRLFIVQQTGEIYVLDKGKTLELPFLDIKLLLTDDVFRGGYSERGLLGLAFDPNYTKNGRFYINYVNREGSTILARYAVQKDNPNQADPASAVTLLTVKQPFDNHNGGMLAFGPDGYLYVGMGDGGSQGDPFGHAQNKNQLLGKILRLDVSGDSYSVPPTNPFIGQANALPEIWAYGLRNPWRFSFDRQTGDLYIADVGGSDFEEINVQPGASKGGENYGWNAYEARARHPEKPDAVGAVVMPVAEYDHNKGCSVTGGYVYRGTALPELAGTYIFGDYCAGVLWTLKRDAAGEWQVSDFGRLPTNITSFGEDEAGELYLVSYKGVIYRLATKP